MVYIIKKRKKEKKNYKYIINDIFAPWNIGLIAFSGFVIYIKTQADPKYEKRN